MGVDKADLLWAGQRAVDRLMALSRQLNAAALVTSGARDFGVPFIADEAAEGGPVSGLAAGAAALALAGCDRVLALPVDAPTVEASDLQPLLDAVAPGAAYRDLNLPLAWDVAATPPCAGPGWSVRRFIEAAGLVRLPCPVGAEARLRGANTPAEYEALLATLAEAEGARNSGAR